MPLIPSATATRAVKEVLNGRSRPAAPGAGWPLPPDAPSDAPSDPPTVAEILRLDGPRLEPVLRRRRSTREFRPEAPDPDQIRRIVTAAHAVDRRQWPSAADQPLSVLVGSSTMPDATPGPDLLPALREAYCEAPVLLFICGDVRAAAQAEHGTGYGSLLVRAGALGYALWMAALAEGLAGSVYGRSAPSVTAAARTLGPGVRHLFTVALGSDAADAIATNATNAPHTPGEAIDHGA